MRFERDPEATGPLVTGFTARGFVCGEIEYREGLLLTPERAERWSPGRVADLAFADLQALAEISPPPEFLLLGTGASLARPDPKLVEQFERRSIGIELMDSRAAARAWGILRGEGRWIAAALMPFA